MRWELNFVRGVLRNHFHESERVKKDFLGCVAICFVIDTGVGDHGGGAGYIIKRYITGLKNAISRWKLSEGESSKICEVCFFIVPENSMGSWLKMSATRIREEREISALMAKERKSESIIYDELPINFRCE